MIGPDDNLHFGKRSIGGEILLCQDNLEKIGRNNFS